MPKAPMTVATSVGYTLAIYAELNEYRHDLNDKQGNVQVQIQIKGPTDEKIITECKTEVLDAIAAAAQKDIISKKVSDKILRQELA